ncbi:MAG: hypothetical protein LBI74_05805, partial [Synergistaceae bacterium]|nr:hypothetical protein [Synergistaceae bacterium]
GKKGQEEKPKTPEPQNQGHDTERGEKIDLKTETKDRNEGMELSVSEPCLLDAILAAYNETLFELPRAERLTSSRIKTLNLRIREGPDREEPDLVEEIFREGQDLPLAHGE